MFLAPYMLFGALAASIPIALHFFFRSRYRTVPWAAMKFLLLSVEQTSRRLKFQELLLLLLRVCVLVLLALALARPLTSIVRGAGQGEAVDAVLLFDVSMSMGASDGLEKTRMERAQDAALKIVDELPPHSTVQIVTFADRDRAEYLGPSVPGNLDQARSLILDLKATSLATDLADGLTMASKRLSQSQTSANKELYVFSDMQKLGWDQQPKSVKSTLEELKEKTMITLVRCGEPDAKLKNVAIVAVTPQVSVPRPNETLDFAVLIKNTGTDPLKDLQLTILVDGNDKNGSARQIPLLKPGELRVVPMQGKMGKAGPCAITALVKPDDVPGDNRYDCVVQVRQQVNVLLVDGGPIDPDDRENATAASSYDLHHALLPVKEADYAKYYMQVTRKSAKNVTAKLLANQDICILLNVKSPPADKDSDRRMHDFLDELTHFVHDGHGLLIYAGENVDPKLYNKVLGDTYGLLPYPIKKLQTFPGKDAEKFNRGTFNLPIYERFKQDPLFASFNDVWIHKYFELGDVPFKRPDPKDIARKEAERKAKDVNGEIDPAKDLARKKDDDKTEDAKKKDELEKQREIATVILRYKNNQPAVVSCQVGAGEVFFVTTSADLGFERDSSEPTWNTWALTNPYNFFLKATVNHLLAEGSQQYNFTAGKTMTWYAKDDDNRVYTLVHPAFEDEKKPAGRDSAEPKDGKQERLGSPTLNKTTGRYLVSANDLYQAGIYKVVSSEIPKTGPDESDQNKDADDGAKNPRKKETPIAVIADLNETENLASYTNDELNERAGFPLHHVLAGRKIEDIGSERLNREWTTWLLTMLLFLTLGESLLAWWCGRGW